MESIGKLKLLHAEHGLRHSNVEKLYVTHNTRLGLVQLSDGEWYGLNNRSCDPTRLDNREERNAWARAIGFKTKDVENYVRKVRAAEKAEYLRQELIEAERLLHDHGYAVTAPSSKRKRAKENSNEQVD